MQLVLSGARDDLKQLTRQRLEESGWTDEVRQLCRGGCWPAGRLRGSRLSALPWTGTQEAFTAGQHAQTRVQYRAPAEFVAKQGADNVRHEDIVAAVKTAARSKVPDHLKAELLKRIRDVLEG